MSRELDARVAEAMGKGPEFDYWKFLDGKGENPFGFVLPADMDHTGTLKQLRENHPNMHIEAKRVTSYKKFSTDPAACEELRKECRRRKWWYEESWDDLTKAFHAVVGDVANDRVSNRFQEEAFCLAFLAAVDAEKGAKQ